jgi:hypothetical protein
MRKLVTSVVAGALAIVGATLAKPRLLHAQTTLDGKTVVVAGIPGCDCRSGKECHCLMQGS